MITRAVVFTDKEATIDESMTTDGELALYDKDNKKLDLKYLHADTEKFQLTIPVLKRKTIPLKLEFTNAPEGFPVDELQYKLSNTSVEFAGIGDVIDNVSEVNIGPVNFRKLDIGSSFKFDVPLTNGFLNVENVDKVLVTFDTKKFSSKLFTVTNLQIQNAPANYALTIGTKSVYNVKIVGPKATIESLTVKDIVGKIDMSDIKVSTGQYTVPVKLSVPKKGTVWAVGEYSAIVSAKPK
jgi:YbbR domain-containing protein